MKKSFGWIRFIAARYISRKKRQKSPLSSVLSIMGIATGVLALLVILAVMNGFQLGFVETILEVSSYHLRIKTEDGAALPNSFLEQAGKNSEILVVSPFIEFQSLIRGHRRNQPAALIRGLQADTLKKDAGMESRLDFESGFFDLFGDDSILLGSELARQLGVTNGDTVSLLSLGGIFENDSSSEFGNFVVRGVFRTGFYEYDLSWAFIPLETAMLMEGGSDSLQYGIKLKNRWHDTALSRELENMAPDYKLNIQSWREFNRAFFGALRTEKILMFILVGLIFIVVGLNIFQSQRRAVLERRDEIGLLRAVGASELSVRMIFTFDGFIIGFTGSSAGAVLGLLISYNIQVFFTIIEQIVNTFLRIINGISSLLSGLPLFGDQSFSFFSPAVFYLKEIPSRVLLQDVIIIYLFGLLSAVIAAWLASGKLARIQPAEVLRYE